MVDLQCCVSAESQQSDSVIYIYILLQILSHINHTYITFNRVYYYNHAILLLVIAVNLLCLLHKLNFIIGMYKKKQGT